MSQPPTGPSGNEPQEHDPYQRPGSQPDPSWSSQPSHGGNQPSYGGNQPSYGGSQPPGYGYGSPQQPAPGTPANAGGLKSLFDFSFNTYATPSIIRIVYILLTVLIGLGTLAFFFGGLMQLGRSSTAAGGLFMMILAPLGGLVYLAIARISLEASVALVRAATELKVIREEASRR